ncbi:MAG TPA: AtpZ/AtpI family protein [Terriglobia bacterium]|nr:AtpZ/AtpI family protein [Terriglobia bacterium]
MPPDWQKQSNVWAQVAYYAGLGFILPAGGVAGYVLGWLLDRWLHSTPWAALLGALGGAAAGLVEVLRVLKRAEDHGSGDNSNAGTGSS